MTDRPDPLDATIAGMAAAVVDLDAAGRIGLAADTADQLDTLLAAVDAGEYSAPATMVAGLRGAAMALRGISV